jgi:hypothetical protein
VFGGDGYIWEFLAATFENWQSEFLQLLAMLVLTSFLIHRGCAESKDSNDRMEARLDEIDRVVPADRAGCRHLRTGGHGEGRDVTSRGRAPGGPDPCVCS